MQPRVGMAITNGDHRPPFGKASTHFNVFLQALAQSIQAFRDLFSGMARHLLRPSIDFDPGMIPASAMTLRNGVPSFFFWRIVSS